MLKVLECGIFNIMKYVISEIQYKLLLELAPHSAGVREFLDMVKNTPGMLKHLQFRKFSDLEEYVSEASYKDFNELKSEADSFKKTKKETPKKK